VARNNTSQAGIVEFKVYDQGGAQLAYWRFDTLEGSASDWRTFTGTVNPPGNTRRARVQVRVVNLNGTLDFDAFSLTAEGSPQAAAVPATELAVPAEVTEVTPEATPVPATAVPPAETAVPPTSAPSEPAATAEPPADTAVPETEPAAPTAAPTAESAEKPRGWGRGGRPGE
jgi:hypothetical protein